MPYIIQGNTISLPTDPFSHAGTQYVSEREVIEALGGSAETTDDGNTMMGTIGPWAAAVKAGDPNVKVDGNGQSVPIMLNSAPYVESGEMFVPFDFFSEAFGYDVSFSDGTLTIINPNAV